MSNIILYDSDFGGELQKTINARDLHQGLGVKNDFPTWFRDQIKARNLIENKDYIVFRDIPENPSGGRPRIEYFVTIRAAKHITAMSRTPGGEEYRDALFNLEEAVSEHRLIAQRPTREAVGIVQDYLDLARLCKAPEHLALIEASKQVKLLGIDISPLLQASPAMDNIPDNQEMLEPTELAKRLGFSSGRAMNKMLAEMGLQARINGEWVPTDAAAGMFFKHSWTKGSKSGCNLKWNLSMVKGKLEAYTESYGSI